MSSSTQNREDFSLEALRSQDRVEFAHLVEIYSGMLHRLANKMLDNPQDKGCMRNEPAQLSTTSRIKSPIPEAPTHAPARRPKRLIRLRAGDLCPTCQSERLDYDGLINLSCPKCGVAIGGCYT